MPLHNIYAKSELEEAEKWDIKLEEEVQKLWCMPIPQTGVLYSKGGATESLITLNTAYRDSDEKPHGVCAAPKMIQQAYQLGLTPVAMAEAWFGGGDNRHGGLVASCDTCMKNIGFQLCEQCRS